jgi:hypothetical protein
MNAEPIAALARIAPQEKPPSAQPGAEGADLAGRPGERAIEHVEGAPEEDDDPAHQPGLEGEQDAADDRDPEADEGQAVRGETETAHRERDRLEDLLDAAAGLVRDRHGVNR